MKLQELTKKLKNSNASDLRAEAVKSFIFSAIFNASSRSLRSIDVDLSNFSEDDVSHGITQLIQDGFKVMCGGKTVRLDWQELEEPSSTKSFFQKIFNH